MRPSRYDASDLLDDICLVGLGCGIVFVWACSEIWLGACALGRGIARAARCWQ